MTHLPCIGWVQVSGTLVLCAYSTLSEFVSFCPSHHFCCLLVCLILLYVLVSVYLLWHKGSVGFWAHVTCPSSFLWIGHCLGKGLHLPVEPMFFFLVSMGLLTIDPAILLHHACYSFTLLFTSCYPVNLSTDVLVVPAYFFVNLLLKAS